MHNTIKYTVLSLTLAAGTAAAQTQLLGVEFRDGSFGGREARLFDVDTTTGAATNARFTGSTGLLGLTQAADGTLYSLTDPLATVNGQPAASQLLTIDPATGTTAVVGDIGFEIFEGDLDFNANGDLFGVSNTNGVSTLFTIDVATGAGTPVGTIPGVSNAAGLAFDDSGSLYLVDVTVQAVPTQAFLVEVDIATAGVVSSVTVPQAFGLVGGLDFDSDGTLYFADGDFNGTNNLYTIDPATGAATTIGTTVDDNFFGGLSGLQFAVVPEPTSVATLGLVGLAMLRRRR